MMEQYGIDLSNNKTYYEDKMDILNTYLGTAGGAWLKYYDIASGKVKDLSGLSLVNSIIFLNKLISCLFNLRIRF